MRKLINKNKMQINKSSFQQRTKLIVIAVVAILSIKQTVGAEASYFEGGDDWEFEDCIKLFRIYILNCRSGYRQSPIDFPLRSEKVKGFKVPLDPPSAEGASGLYKNEKLDNFLDSSSGSTFIPREESIKRVLTWSPSDFDHKFDTLHLLSYDLDYEEFANLTLQNLTETIRAEIDHIDGYFVVYEDDRTTEVFKPLQFHFHSPSEHTFDGKHYDLELHIYHISIDKKHKSVLAVYFDIQMGGDKESPFLTSVFENSEKEENQKWVPDRVSIEGLLEKLDKKKMFHYEGSLTTPPCTQNVEWNIIDDPQPISQKQLEVFTRKWKGNVEFAGGRGNNRKIQPLLERKIYYQASYSIIGRAKLIIILALTSISIFLI